MRRVDAHHHFWRPARGDYTWLREDDPTLAALYRDFLPQELVPSLEAAAVTKTVLVQAAGTEAETDFMLDLASQTPFVGGVVGWVDLSDKASIATLQRWARNPLFKGVRPMLQDLPDPDWIATAPHPDVIRALIELGLRFDALVKPPHLPALTRFVQAWPALPVVIDHAAKPQLAAGWGGDWAADWHAGMRELAALPHVHCKFSGLVTEMAPSQRASLESCTSAVRPVWDALVDLFGPARLMWGSDWPVLLLAGYYDGWVRVAQACIATLPVTDQAAVWHGNAERFYGLA